MQKSAEKTFTTSFNRIMGTAVGGVFGVVVLFLETELHVCLLYTSTSSGLCGLIRSNAKNLTRT